MKNVQHMGWGLKAITILLVTIAVLLALILLIQKYTREAFQQQDGSYNKTITLSMNEDGVRRRQLAMALLSFDPRTMKYQDPRRYDFHVAGTATLAWRTRMNDALSSIGDRVIESVLGRGDAIVLFDGPNLSGNIIFIALEGVYPKALDDAVMYNKYVKWAPPAKELSAIVPSGFRMRIEYQDGRLAPQEIGSGITTSIGLLGAVKTVTVLKA